MSNKTGRNDKCFCGSGLKYKKCCINKVTNINPITNHSKRMEELLPNSNDLYGIVLGIYKWDDSKIQKVGNQMMNNLLDNKIEVSEILKSIFKIDFNEYQSLFEKHVFLPYFFVGSRFNKRFNEYYDFISEFSIGSLEPKKPNLNMCFDVFRVMTIEEYNNLKNGDGIESPSFSLSPFCIEDFFNNNILHGVTNKNVIVKLSINTFDIIYKSPTREEEVLLKKGSVPNSIDKIFEIGIDDVIEDYGKEILNHIPLNPLKSCNGFCSENYLKSIGFIPNHIKRTQIWELYVNEVRKLKSIHTLQKVL